MFDRLYPRQSTANAISTYMGWHLTVRVPWQNTLGLAISEGPGQPFRRWSRFPMMSLDDSDPYTISYPWVLREGGRFRMWYGSNVAWGRQKEDMRHLIKYAESADGIHSGTPRWYRGRFRVYRRIRHVQAVRDQRWRQIQDVVLLARLQLWIAFVMPSSTDGISWQRVGDKAGIDVSAEGWIPR